MDHVSFGVREIHCLGRLDNTRLVHMKLTSSEAFGIDFDADNGVQSCCAAADLGSVCAIEQMHWQIYGGLRNAMSSLPISMSYGYYQRADSTCVGNDGWLLSYIHLT